jgi:hypothetical protein
MADPRFDELREALLRAGVAGRKVRRAMAEIESHFQQLIEDGCARGATPDHACQEAHERLGTNQCLVQSYVARPELRSWSRRWPAVFFILLPLIAYIGICAAILLTALMVADHMAPYLHQVHVPPQVTNAVDLAAGIMLLGLLPLLVVAAFAVLAYRRRVSFGWPFSGIMLISGLVSLANVAVRLTGGPTAGEVGAGIGFSPESLPGQLARAVVLTSLATIPLWFAVRRQQRANTSVHINSL